MVEISTKVETPTQRAKARMARMQTAVKRPGIRVVPRDDDMRRLMKHPRVGGFRSQGSMEWPDDTFTHRRLRDGSVKLEEKHEKKADEHKSSRHSSHNTAE